MVRTFPNQNRCLRLDRALAMEVQAGLPPRGEYPAEDWPEANRYLRLGNLGELKKERLRQAA